MTDETHERVAEAMRRATEAQARAMETLLRVREDNARRLAQLEPLSPRVAPGSSLLGHPADAA